MTDLTQLPAISAIYRVWCNDEVVYVGQTKNLKQRWQTHHILPKLLKHYGTDWWIDWTEIQPLYLDRAEAFAHRHFQPALNHSNPSSLLGLSAESN
ncbi:MAG: GIY-YIG nuclease family protein [Cyanobacteria bacterium J06621_3]